jgi:hypothetical protein
MPARLVRAPDGRTWVVRRRWSSSRETLGRRFWRRATSPLARARVVGDVSDAGSLFGDLADLPVVGAVFFGIAAVLLVVLCVLLMAVVVVPLLIALAELGVLLAIAALAVAGRLVLRHPWTIEARADDGTTLRWHVVGWRASRAHGTTIATTLAAGTTPPPNAPPTPTDAP